jgi:hypothetical protein
MRKLARRGFSVTTGVVFHPPEDERPAGALEFADPATAEFPREVQTFDPPEYRSINGQSGRHMNGGARSITGRLVPYQSRQAPQDSWAEMNKKRGVIDNEVEHD